MEKNISLAKYLLTCALGFGLGGFFWGVVMYSGIPDIEHSFQYLAVISISLFGGISLKLFSQNTREIIKSILFLSLGLGIGFYVVYSFGYYLFLYGGLVLLPLGYLIEIEILNEFFNLSSSIRIGDFWLMFFITGFITGFSYSLFFKTKKWPLIWRGGVGFALGSLIAPVIGNSFGILFNSLLVSYLLTFSLMSAIFGIFLSWGVYRFQKKEEE